MELKKSRFPLIDQIRGFAVLLMIIFHFSYDLNFFGFVKIDFYNEPLWYWFPRLIVFLFLSAVGLSFPLVHGEGIRWKTFWKRWVKLVFLAVLISISTYFMFPKGWIYFGTLHCIATISLMILPFVSRPKASLAIGCLIGLAVFIPGFKWPWFSLPHKSMDYIPALPWVYVSLIFIFLNSLGLHKWGKDWKILKPLSVMGRHSLVIYMLHQPILFGLTFLASKLIKG